MAPKGSKQPRKAAQLLLSAGGAAGGAANGGHGPSTGHSLAGPLPAGELLTGLAKTRTWRLGRSIGVGGFGEIYLCSSEGDRASVGDDAALAVKVEPHTNGPLFVEMNFYLRACQPADVEAWAEKRARGGRLGMPIYRGSGSHVYQGSRYRFLVMDRYGKDLQKVFEDGKRPFSVKAAFNIALKVLDVLEYIHSRGYVHNDIKAQNLLLGYGRTKENDVYLVDFGLVSKYQRDGVHYLYKPDARKAHDGTIEYTSRDAHIGAHSRRSDLEILAYNLVHWMSGTLPWLDCLANETSVHAKKKMHMENVEGFLETCFGEMDYPAELEEFINYILSLEFDSEPDYDFCRNIFSSGLRKRRYPLDGKIDFTMPKAPPKKARRRPRKRASSVRSAVSTPAVSPGGGESGANTRSAAAESEGLSSWCWESVLCSDPEALIRQASRNSEADDESPLAVQHRQMEERRLRESLKNPTQAMKDVMKKMEVRENERQQMSWQQQLQHLTKGNKSRNNQQQQQVWDLTPNPLTPAMEEVIQLRQKRISVDIDTPITPEPSDEDEDDEESDYGEEEEEEDESEGEAGEEINSSRYNDPGAGPSHAVSPPTTLSDAAVSNTFLQQRPLSSSSTCLPTNFLGSISSKSSNALNPLKKSKEKWLVGEEASSAAPIKKEDTFLDSVQGLKKMLLAEKAKNKAKETEESPLKAWDLSDEEEEAETPPNMSPRKTRAKVKQESDDMNAAFDALLASPFKNPIFERQSESSSASSDEETTDQKQPCNGFNSACSSGVPSKRNSPEPTEELSLPVNSIDQMDNAPAATAREELGARRRLRKASSNSSKASLSMGDEVDDALFEEMLQDSKQHAHGSIRKRNTRASRSRKNSSEEEVVKPKNLEDDLDDDEDEDDDDDKEKLSSSDEEVVFKTKAAKRKAPTRHRKASSEVINVPETVMEEDESHTDPNHSNGYEGDGDNEDEDLPPSPVRTRKRARVASNGTSANGRKARSKAAKAPAPVTVANGRGQKRKASTSTENGRKLARLAADEKVFKKPAAVMAKKKIATRSSRSTRSDISTSLSYNGRRRT